MHDIFTLKRGQDGKLVVASDWKQNHTECVDPIDSRQASPEL